MITYDNIEFFDSGMFFGIGQPVGRTQFLLFFCCGVRGSKPAEFVDYMKKLGPRESGNPTGGTPLERDWCFDV